MKVEFDNNKHLIQNKKIETSFDYEELTPATLSGRIDDLLLRLINILHFNIDENKKLDDNATLDQRKAREKEQKQYYRLAGAQAVGIFAGLIGASSACFDKDGNIARALTGIQAVTQGTKEVLVTFPQAQIQKIQGVLNENSSRLQQLSKEDERVYQGLEQLRNALLEAERKAQDDLMKPFQG